MSQFELPRTLRFAASARALLLVASVCVMSSLPQQGSAQADCAGTVSLEEFQRGVREANLYAGGPTAYTDVGRRTLAKSIDIGLNPEDTLLDIGAGSLRIGWWLLQYIQPSNYYAIEPVKDRVDKAAEILGADIRLFYNEDFVFPDAKFDFVLARSIWTHASKAMISKMLSEFAQKGTPDARFLASVYFAKTPESDYMGEHWIGMDRKFKGASIVAHTREWIESECAKYGLSFEVGGELHGQTWVIVGKQPKAEPAS